MVVADAGRRDGETFLLVHGIGVGSRYFERLVPELATRGRVVAIDLPGFGRAREERPGHPLTVEDYADVVARLIDRRGLAPAVIVGHSMGTQIAARLARVRPDLVRRLVLLGPVVAPRDRGPVRSAIRLVLDTLRESFRANRVVLGDYLVCGPRWYLAVLPSMLRYRIEDDLPALDLPVAVVRGARDPIARDAWTRRLAALAPRGRFAVVPGAPHVVMHARPRETADEVVRWA